MEGTPLFRTWFRLLTLRPSQQDFDSLNSRFLEAGLLSTWAVGMGRYWDDPDAPLLQHLGLGSLVYVPLLSALLWIIVAPLRPAAWSYRRVLTFVALTSPPALLYAIPVERLCSLERAQAWNLAFLAVVATWRLMLLVLFLRRSAQLSRVATAVAVCLPSMGIIVSLVMLNLERAVFDMMGGLRHTANDGAYGVLVLLTWLSCYLILPIAIVYVVLIAFASKRKRLESRGGTVGSSGTESASDP